MSEKAENLRDLIAQLPSSPTLWNTLLREAVWATECTSGVLLITDLRNGGNNHSEHVHNVPLAHKQLYESHFNAIDRFNEMLALQPDRVMCTDRLPVERCNEEVEGDFMSPLGYGHRLGVSIACNQRYSINLYLNRDAAFSEAEQARGGALLGGLVQPLRAALEAERRQAFARALFLESGMLDDFVGFAIVDGARRVLHREQGFALAIEGLAELGLQNGRLCIGDASLEAIFCRMLGGGCSETVALADGEQAFELLMLPSRLLNGLLPWERPVEGVLLALYGLERRRFVSGRFRSVYGLTPAETELVINFARKPDLNQLSVSMHRSRETLRNHLKRAMHKLDIHSQAELVRVVTALTLP